MREDETVDTLQLPNSLTNTERKFIHQLAPQLGLVSKSHGKGDSRRITIFKPTAKQTVIDDASLPYLSLGSMGLNRLASHLSSHPPALTPPPAPFNPIYTPLPLAPRIPPPPTLGAAAVAAVMRSHDGRGRAINDVPGVNRIAVPGGLPPAPLPLPPGVVKNNNYARDGALPITPYYQLIVDTVATHRVTLLHGSTGCGKSTQVPQFILRDDPRANVVVTQPRRISAMSLAERVSVEWAESYGGGGGGHKVGGLIGYQVRLDSKLSDRTQCLFLTPGTLLRKLSVSNFLMEGYSHVVLDEVHERDKYTEFLMICLKQIMYYRSDLRVILMSATLNQDDLISYWSSVGGEGCGSGRVGVVGVPGRIFPVQEYYLEDVLKITGFDASVAEDDGNNAKGVKERCYKRKKENGEMVCIMCDKGGFKCAEELGDHVAMCMGKAGEEIEVLERRVRNCEIDENRNNNRNRRGWHAAKKEEVMAFEDSANANDVFADVDDEGEISDNGEDVVPWDGISPFFNNSTSQTTLSDNELLSRYQTVHDDEQIDNDLIIGILKFIIQSSYGDGAVLIFFPGWMEISEFQMLLKMTEPFGDENRYSILPLHSGVSSREQRRVFGKMKRGCRKIVLATNIAETSVTIEDVTFVIDTGKVKEKNYDPHLKTSTLTPVWVSQASASQRRGRAGRTKPGVCFRLFSSRRFSDFRLFTESELLRTPLEEMCLQCKRLGIAPGFQNAPDGIPAFLSKALAPPHPKSVINAIDLLVKIGAMQETTNELTPLGIMLSQLSLEPRVGKMVIWSHLLGCALPISTMGVATSYKNPFNLPPPSLRRAAEQAKIILSKQSESDPLTILHALQSWDEDKNRTNFCYRYFLSAPTLQTLSDLRRHVSGELTRIGFPSPHKTSLWHNRNKDDMAYLQAAILSGMYPNVALRRKGEINFTTVGNRKAKMHVSSLNSCKGQPLAEKCTKDIEFVVFGEMIRGVNFFTMADTTRLVSPVGLVLLCGTVTIRDSDDEEEMVVLSVDDWIHFRVEEEVGRGLLILRDRLNRAFLDFVKNNKKGLNGLTSQEDRDAVETLGVLLKSGHYTMLRR